MRVISNMTELKDFINNNQVSLYGAGGVGKAIIEWIEDIQLSTYVDSVFDSNKSGKIYGFTIHAKEEYTGLTPLIISTKSELAYEIAKDITINDSIVILSDSLCEELLSYMNNKYLIKLSDKITDRIGNVSFWENERERQTLINTGWGVLNNKIFEKYCNLISNIDDTSVGTVNTIIARISRIINSNCKRLDIFSEEEQSELHSLEKNFFSQIIKVDESIYAYRNFILPKNHFEPSVFLFKHQIDVLINREKLIGTTFIDAGGFIGDSVLVLE